MDLEIKSLISWHKILSVGQKKKFLHHYSTSKMPSKITNNPENLKIGTPLFLHAYLRSRLKQNQRQMFKYV